MAPRFIRRNTLGLKVARSTPSTSTPTGPTRPGPADIAIGFRHDGTVTVKLIDNATGAEYELNRFVTGIDMTYRAVGAPDIAIHTVFPATIRAAADGNMRLSDEDVAALNAFGWFHDDDPDNYLPDPD